MKPPSYLDPEQGRTFMQAFEHAFSLLDDLTPGQLGFFGKRRLNKARDLTGRCAELADDYWGCLWLRAKAYQAVGEHRAALALFDAAAADAPEETRLMRDATVSALATGDGERAERFARTAAELRENEPSLLCNYALALLLIKDGKRALGVVTNAYKIAPGDPTAQFVIRLVRKILKGEQEYPDRFEVG